MPLVLSYCLKFSVSIALIYLFYQLVLRRLTFYNWNRFYLLGYLLVSFFFAFVNISPVLQQNNWSESHLVQWIPALNSSTIITGNNVEVRSFNIGNAAALIFMIGMTIMFCRLGVQLFSFYRMMKRAEPISAGEMNFYQVNDSVIPFSFGKSIFLNRHLHSEEELREIIRHEFVHVKQRHSIDIIIGEILCLFNWYNPFAWLLRSAIRQNLEFIADNKVLQNGINKKEYQYLLLKVIGNNQFSIAQKFNFSSLKKRIAMMNKIKTARINLLRFLFILPLLAVLLLAFRNKNIENHVSKSANSQVKISDEFIPVTVAKDYADTTPKPGTTNKNEIDLSRVSDDYEITDDRAVIHLKNGMTEEYDLKNKKQRNKFEKKYGKIIAVYPSQPDNIKEITVVGKPLTKTYKVKPDVKEITVVGKPLTETYKVKPDLKEVTVVGKPLTVATTVRPDIKEVTVVGKPLTVATTVSPDIKEVTVVGVPLKVATTVSSNPVSNVNVVNTPKIISDQEMIRDADILITIKNTTKPDELEEFIKKLKEKGYELTFTNKNYKDGVLIQLSGTIKYKENSSTFSFSDFNQATIASFRDGDEVNFRIYTGKRRVTS